MTNKRKAPANGAAPRALLLLLPDDDDDDLARYVEVAPATSHKPVKSSSNSKKRVRERERESARAHKLLSLSLLFCSKNGLGEQQVPSRLLFLLFALLLLL